MSHGDSPLLPWLGSRSHILLSREDKLGTEKTMTATDVTGFCAFFSARKSGNLLHILGRFPYSITQKTWRKWKKIHWLEKIQKKNVETAPRNCRFLSLVVVERALTNVHFSNVHLVLCQFSCLWAGSCRRGTSPFPSTPYCPLGAK